MKQKSQTVGDFTPQSPGGLLTLLCSALFFSRWFLPAEAPDLGVTLWISLLTIAVAGVGHWWMARLGETPPRLNRLDACVVLLIGGHLLSMFYVLTFEGDRRAALNIGWEWLALGAQYSWFRRGVEFRPSLRMIVITLVTLAVLGTWQHHVWYPRMARALDAALTNTPSPDVDPQLVSQFQTQLSSMDEVGQQLMLARMRDSSEPLARFSLTNTLAGLLGAGIFLGACLGWPKERRWSWQNSLWGLGTVLLCYCLLLTKSRTAYLAVLAALGFSGLKTAWNAGSDVRRRLLQGMGFLSILGVVVVAVLLRTGSLDREVLTESTKSLRYRIEYWQGSWEVLKTTPLFGTGPGNFRQHYLRYKLPESSEEILDPHNQFLDAWANGGLLALLGLTGIWVQVLRQFQRSDLSGSPVSAGTNGSPFSLSKTAAVTSLLLLVVEWGLLGGGDSNDLILYGLWCGLALLVDLSTVGQKLPMIAAPTHDVTARLLTTAGWGALSLHLCGAGGIGMVAVSQLWLLLALVVTAPEKLPPVPDSQQPVTTRVIGPVFWGLSALACLYTSLIPSIICRSAQDLAVAAMAGQVPASLARKNLEEAIDLDVIAPEPPQALAELLISEWQQGGVRNDDLFEEAVRLQELAIERDPLSPKRYRVLGQYWWMRYQNSGDSGDARHSRDAYAQAVMRYPNHVKIQAEYTLTLQAAGDDPAEAARHALELHEINRKLMHTDKLLSEEQITKLKQLLDSSAPVPQASPAPR